MQGYIYLIENKVNGKKHIGQTVRDVKTRFDEHCKDIYRLDFPLYRAMRKYGVENFRCKEIEKCDVTTLSSREVYWIDYYDTYKKGYNATMGGEGKPLYDHNEIIQVFQETQSISGTATKIGCCNDTVYKTLKYNNVSKPNPIERATKNFGKPIDACDLKSGKLVKSFLSQSEAGRWIMDQGLTKVKEVHKVSYIISRAARGLDNRTQAYGYVWRYE